jgi:hypothetical protein
MSANISCERKVAGGQLADALTRALARPGAPSRRECARETGISPKAVRNILGYKVGLVDATLSERLLSAACAEDLIDELDQLVPAGMTE